LAHIQLTQTYADVLYTHMRTFWFWALIFVLGCFGSGSDFLDQRTDCELNGLLPVGEARVDESGCRLCTCTPDGLACEPVECVAPEIEVEPEAGPQCPTGRVTGRVCSPNGESIPGADVLAATTDCAGRAQIVQTTSDGAGNFVLEGLTPGATTITLAAGRFQTRHDVDVEAGRTVPLDGDGDDKRCLAADAARMAVITGDYDAIEDVLSRLGFEYDLYCGDGGQTWPARALLGDWERLRTYDIVFLNCGAHLNLDRPETGPQIRANLRRFVDEGGSVYASDLSAGVVSRVWPGAVQFELLETGQLQVGECCTCLDCPAECNYAELCLDCCSSPTDACAERLEVGGGFRGVVEAQVVSPALAAFLGRARFDIDFDLQNWVGISGISVASDVLVRSAARPLMVLFGAGDAGGRVAYTSFHTETQVDEDVELILRALIFQL
jgi:hypothetical protein